MLKTASIPIPDDARGRFIPERCRLSAFTLDLDASCVQHEELALIGASADQIRACDATFARTQYQSPK